jgi:transcriptional regulator with XRE-family HTH domain
MIRSGTDLSAKQPSETVGERIRRLRRLRGLSLRDIQAPGVSFAYISRVERGGRQPSMKVLRVLARNLGVTAEYLETGDTLSAKERLELRLTDAEIELRLSDSPAALESLFRDLHAEALEVSDHATATRARVGAGLAAAAGSHHARAASELERAVRTGNISPSTHADVYVALAKSFVEAGRQDLGVELLRDCVNEIAAETPVNDAVYVKFATYLSCALDDLGDREEAAEVLREASSHVGELVDPFAHVRVLWSRARLLSTLEPMVALRCMRQAIALLETSEDTLQLARAHLMSASILLGAGDTRKAERHFRLAEAVLVPSGDMSDKAALRAEQAKLAARTGRGADAVRLAREALDLLEGDTPAERGRALWALAEGLAAVSDEAGAEAAFADAAQLLAVEHREVPVLHAWATYLETLGRTSEANEVSRRARVDSRERGSVEPRSS